MGLDLKSKLLRNEKGTSIVELAIILPLLIILIFGMVEFSVLFYDKAVITNASREGARAAIVFRADPATGNYIPLSLSNIQGVVNTYVSTYLVGFPRTTATVPTYTACPSTPTLGVDDFVVVTVSYDYNFLLLPNFLNFLYSPFTLTATTTMSCENRR